MGLLKPMNDGNSKWALFSPTDSRMPRMMIPADQLPTGFFDRPQVNSRWQSCFIVIRSRHILLINVIVKFMINLGLLKVRVCITYGWMECTGPVRTGKIGATTGSCWWYWGLFHADVHDMTKWRESKRSEPIEQVESTSTSPSLCAVVA